MKWIKASERLPKKRQVVVVKIVTDNNVIMHHDGYVDEFVGKVQWFLGDHRVDFPVKLTKNIVEWLDEESTSPVQGVEELVEDIISHAVNNKYRVDAIKNETAHWEVDFPSIKSYIISKINSWQQSQSNAGEQDELWEDVINDYYNENSSKDIDDLFEWLQSKYSITKNR